MARIGQVLDWLRARLWLIPAGISALALALAVAVLRSRWNLAGDGDVWWLFSGDAGTARDLLSTLLSGMITMTSLVVSITIVVLSLAAGQLGPRLIWNFIGDRQIQAVIGLFLGTILYILVILRSINEELGAGHVPHLAITLASLLVLACLFALLFHVNKLARSIVSDTVVDQVAGHLDAAIARLPAADGADREVAPAEALVHGHALELKGNGYVQMIDYAGLCRVAAKHDLVVAVDLRPGDFVLEGVRCLRIRAAGAFDELTAQAVRGTLVLGAERTPTQDLEFLTRQLVEVAVRALSPSLNDPFTALAVVNRLAAALGCLSRKSVGPTILRDEKGILRVVASRSDFVDFVDVAFHPIRQAASRNVQVLAALARRLAELVRIVDDGRRAPLLRHLRILEHCVASLAEPDDRRALAAIIEPAMARFAPDGD